MLDSAAMQPLQARQAIPDADATGALAALCKAGAEPLRLAVLRLLHQDSFGVLELCHILDCKQSGLSHHLKILATAGLVTHRREGNSLFYRRADTAQHAWLEPLQQALCTAATELPLDAATRARLLDIQQLRAQRSRQFFAEHAHTLKRQQERVASFELYGPAAADLLAESHPGGGTALEVGPGDGGFLPILSQQFARVIGLDNAPEMLARARETVAAQALGNVELLAGDTASTALPADIDWAVLNMVLHHNPEPAAIFRDLARLLRTGGQLLVTELCRHDQGWTRESCGDLWLGFQPEDLSAWAEAADFSEGKSIYLAQRNGFRVQIRHFIKHRA